ncbi:cyclodeaminase/cyclohydrolase family protein [Paenibacillus guangzhouensis]|uniref:cyclodeaminase/cyclohydrolase family protein n=1 Tax=Paenibacillus guangzhouensis TaxID=1473112 RepID=UPI001267468C|nr:cyclodeaminase/cyclohydrolase family protein [Paenibacillus guangzhouensis]
MRTNLWDQSIRTFVEQAGSARPTPGGGSVAALVAALGASMTSMVGNLSLGEKYAAYQEQMLEALDRMNKLTAIYEQLLAQDIDCFEQYMAALKLPRNTEEERAARTAAMEQATIQAIDVPLRLIEACLAGIRHAKGIVDCCNPYVLSDLGISAILLEAAASSALLTAQINLVSLKDASLKQQYHDSIARLMTDIDRLKQETMGTVRTRMGV